MAGLPMRLFKRLHSDIMFAMSLLDSSIYSARRKEHNYRPMSPLLRELHWLRVPQQFEFRFAVIVYRCLDGIMVHQRYIVAYLADMLQRVVDTSSRSRLRSASTAH